MERKEGSFFMKGCRISIINPNSGIFVKAQGVSLLRQFHGVRKG